PVAVAGTYVPRHGSARRLAVAGQERLDDGQMFVGLLGKSVEIVAGFVALPGDIAEGPKQRLEPGNLLSQIRIAARFGNEIVQPAIDGAGLFDEARSRSRPSRDHSPQIVGQGVQLGEINPAASRARRLALQSAANLANLADLVRRETPDAGA